MSLALAAAPAPAARPTQAAPGPAAARAPPPSAERPWCTGAYASDFRALTRAALERSDRADAQFTYCLRSTATYECLSYAPDGSVRKTRREATSHGTGFGLRRQAGDTLLVTNHHVAEYAPVTDDEHPVSGVPAGCKRVADELRIVENERDTFAADDIPLARVVADPSLDVAVVKAKAPLTVMPWKVGRSAALKERSVVEVRGFPLGAFRAVTQGRVTSVFDHDDFGEWDHTDFVVDAQLSTGNSGSPVLAVSCETGEYELVGVFHADYARGKSLNVVVHVDEVHELLTTLKRSPRPTADSGELSPTTRRRLAEAAADSGHLYFGAGGATAELFPGVGGALGFALYAREFPSQGWPVLVVEDLDTSDQGGAGRIGRVWFGNARGLQAAALDALEDADRVTLERAVDALRRAALGASDYRRAVVRAPSSREATQALERVEKAVRRLAAHAKEPVAGAFELAERFGPTGQAEAVADAHLLLQRAAPAIAAPAGPEGETRRPAGDVKP